MFANLTILNLQMCDSLTNQADFTIYIWPLELKKTQTGHCSKSLAFHFKRKRTNLSICNKLLVVMGELKS